jgi:hypothetical protein
MEIEETPTQQESMDVPLKNGQTIHLVSVERDDEQGVVGVTNSGKRFVATRDVIGEPEEGFVPEPEPMPARHRFRVYLRNGEIVRAVDPKFESIEKWYFDGGLGDTCKVRVEDGSYRVITHTEVLTILSAMPEDEARAQASAN